MSFKDLFRPKWKHSDEKVREEEVRKIRDRDLLVEIAINDPSKNVRGTATYKLFSMSCESGNEELVSGISDLNILNYILDASLRWGKTSNLKHLQRRLNELGYGSCPECNAKGGNNSTLTEETEYYENHDLDCPRMRVTTTYTCTCGHKIIDSRES